MNNKIQIWKRKLAKNHRKQQQVMWDKLKQVHKPKYDSFGSTDALARVMAKQIADEIDAEIIATLKGDLNVFE